MTTPEPSTLEPLTTEELDELAAGCRFVRDSPAVAAKTVTVPADGMLRLIAQARAARPSPTCATCKWWNGSDQADYKVLFGRCTNKRAPMVTSACGLHCKSDFGCNFYEPSPPAQDGGRPRSGFDERVEAR